MPRTDAVASYQVKAISVGIFGVVVTKCGAVYTLQRRTPKPDCMRVVEPVHEVGGFCAA